MKRTLISLLLLFCLCLSMAAPVFADQSDLLWDDAGLLTQKEAVKLNQQLAEISNTYQAQIRIVTVLETPGGDSTAYVKHLYNSNGFGYGSRRDGVLLLICMDLREIRILSDGFAGDAIGDPEIDAIGDAIAPFLSDGDYSAAFDRFIRECGYYIDGHLNGFPFDWKGAALTSAIIGLVIGLIVVFILKGQLKSVRKQNLASNYVRQDSMHLTHSSDLYLYSHVTRTRKESNKSSGGPRGGGGGGSRHVGGRSF